VTDEHIAASLVFVMLSEALQRNPKDEARLAHISDYCLGERGQESNLRFFASLRMTR
jgi:hypothetical protein